MIRQNKMKSFLSLVVMMLFIFSSMSLASGLNAGQPTNPEITTDRFESQDHDNGIATNPGSVSNDGKYSEDTNVGEFLGDNDQEYTKRWDPWLTKAGINAIATTEDGDMMALASGYLYDDQIHLYRWNYDTDQYDLVSEVGGGVFKSDVTSLAFADTDYNNLTEIIAGSEDGYLYVFEQRHLYDPYTNTENMFDLVWKSPRLGRIFSVIVDDTDRDYRQDIIVGTGDTVRWYEYDTHGSYPFGEDHWIEFKEVFSYKMPSQVTALAITDLEYNGLKEVAVGMRSGEIQLLENNGTNLWINGYPYPIAQDNSYRSIWSNGNLIQRDISDMSGGDIDGDGQIELVIAVQGTGAFVLDEVGGEIAHYRLQRPFEPWESNPKEIYPLDYYADAMLNSSSLFNGTLVSNPNVWYNNNTVSGKYGEPLNYSVTNFMVYPYTSASVMKPDGNVTVFDATNSDAWAIYDMGNDEEGAGNGVPSLWDLQVATTSATNAKLSVSISADGDEWYDVNATYVSYNSLTKSFEIEVDPTLAVMSSLFYRYLKLNLTQGEMKVDYIYTPYINNPIYDALSVEVGPLIFEGDSNPTTVGFIATIDGSILAVGWNTTTSTYEIMWDSWTAERYKLGTNVFDLEMVRQKTRFPAWMDYGSQTFTLDLSSATLPDGGMMMSYTAENFYNYRNERSTEFIVSSSYGNMFVYKQDSPYTAPVYDPDLTNMLFGVSDSISLQTFMSIKRSQGVDYFTASLIPIETRFASEFTKDGVQAGVNTYIDPVLNGYWLFVGSWDGYVAAYDTGSISVTPYINDISVWYLTQSPSDYGAVASNCEGFSFPECAYFSPLVNLTSGIQSLTNMELTGVMDGVFRESSWAPKVSSADFIGSEYQDLVMTNGKVHLLETVLSQNTEKVEPENWVNPADDFKNYLGIDQSKIVYTPPKQELKYVNFQAAINTEFSQYNFVYKSDYFKEINEDSKGRKWTNAQPIDFDNDGDFDLILGFARYQVDIFGIDKKTFGVTYWENQGTSEEPKWVEQKKAMNNNQIGSNFQNERWTEPVLSFNTYSFPDGVIFDPKLGYHPLYKTDLPDVMYMFKTNDGTDFYQGILRGFYADYNARTSLLAATYPEAKRLDINLFNNGQTGLDRKVNYGYHIFETWSNEQELNGWTMSMDSADLDGDGKNEIIVGDFNNNAYVFEHLNNNTFKRAYKTFDLNRTTLTDKSPYAYEQFGGISGTFYRTVFEHAQYLIAGFDLNQNGQNEFVVATGSQIYIFESVRTSVNRIRDDTYQLIRIFDLYDSRALTQMTQEDIVITALTWGNDITRNGKMELIVAVTNALLVLEVDTAPYAYEYSMNGIDPFTSSLFTAEEIFFGDTYDLKGKYDVPGNFILNPDYIISTIIVDDFDRDGRLDLIYAGTDTSSARPIWSGFITGLEWDGSAFVSGFDSEMFADTVEYNPINDLAVMDADYDELFELVIGHSYGVDIYEFTDTDTAVLRDVITSSPHYMLPRRSYFTPPASANGFRIVSRFKDVIRLDSRPIADGFGPNNTIFMAYANWDQGGTIVTNRYNKVSFASSQDDGNTWRNLPGLDLNVDGSTYYYSVDKLSMAETADGSIWLAITLRYNTPTESYSGFQFWRLPIKSTSWTMEYSFTASGQTYGLNEPNPKVVSIANDPTSSSSIWAAFTWGNSAWIQTYKITTAGLVSSSGLDMFWADNNATDPGNYSIYDLDMEYFAYEDGAYRFGMAMSGYINAERLSLDTDIFYANGFFNSTTSKLEFERPQRTFASGIGAYYPSLIRERDTDNLLITFEQPTLRAYGGLFAVWSNTGGREWNGPYDMSHPLGFDLEIWKAFPSPSGETYRVGTSFGGYFLRGFKPQSPVLVPGMNRGFTMTYSVKIQLESPIKYSLCNVGQNHFAEKSSQIASSLQTCNLELNFLANAFNPWSNWSWYDVGKVTDIAVGDSDGDYRQEILVASGKNAHLFEFESNTATEINYKQKWTSPDYERDITSVAISDANGNGAPELFVESDRGIVHSYEVVDVNPATAPFMRPGSGTMASLNSTDSLNSVDTYDINGDGILDVVTSSIYGNVYAVDGVTKGVIWQFDNPVNSQIVFPYRPTGEIVEDNGSTYYLVYANDTIYNLDITTGSLLASRTFSFAILVTDLDDVDGDGFMDAVAISEGGRMTVFKASDLTILLDEIVYTATETYDAIGDAVIGNFLEENMTSIAFVSGSGNVSIVNPSDGSIMWSTVENISYYGLATHTLQKGYFDGDEMLDLFIYGSPYAIAVSPYKGGQLWNRTLTEFGSFISGYERQRGMVDVNGDNVTDIFITPFSSDKPEYIALDGRSGNTLYKFDLNIGNRFVTSAGLRHTTLSIGGEERQVFTIYAGTFWDSEPSYVSVVDAESGLPIATALVDSGLFATVANDGPQQIPTIYAADWSGNVSFFKLFEGVPEPTKPTDVNNKINPFIQLGTEFTRRTEYFLFDAFAKEDPTQDGIDDIFVVDDYFAGGADTFLLENEPGYNKAVWSQNDLDFGRYMGGAFIADFGGSVRLVVPYEYVLLSFDIYTGAIMDKWDYSPGDFNTWNNLVMEVTDWDNDGLNDVVYSRTVSVGGSWYIEYGWFNAGNFQDGPKAFTRQSGFVKPSFIVTDLDSDGQKELVTFSRAKFNQFVGNLTIFSNLGMNRFYAPSFINPNDGIMPFFPITNLLFSTGKVLYFTIDYSVYNIPGLPFDLSTFPSLILGFEWTGTGFAWATQGALGISELPGFTREIFNVIDSTGREFLIGVGRRGDLYSQEITTSFTLKQMGVFDSLAVPYARKYIEFGNFCGTSSFYMVTSATSVGCYDSFDFSGPLNAKASIDLDFDIIQDIVKGDLDDDNVDDLIVTSRDGFVWIVSSQENALALELLAPQNVVEETTVVSNQVQNVPQWIYIALASTISLGTLVIKKKE